jgi:putative nucleotidyltransferase with HDIG domain
MNSAIPAKDFHDAVARKIHQERLDTLNPAKRFLDSVANLPPAPMVATQLLALFQSPECDVDRIVQLIGYEPSLTAQVLRNSNSAFYASETPIADIFEAVARLGFYQVYCLVVSLHSAKTRAMEGAQKGVDVDALWRHSVAVAVSASVVAEETGQARAVGFTAGLLHDIGKLVLASVQRENYAVTIKKAKDQRVALSELERAAFIIDHAELGGELMQRWNLPPEVAAAVRYHHDLNTVPKFEKVTAAVQIGDAIGHQLLSEDLVGTDVMGLPTSALEVLSITPADLSGLAEQARAEMENVKGMLDI